MWMFILLFHVARIYLVREKHFGQIKQEFLATIFKPDTNGLFFQRMANLILIIKQDTSDLKETRVCHICHILCSVSVCISDSL